MKVTEGLAIAVVSAAIGSAATIYASSLSYFNASRELDIKMVNVALQILSANEKGDETQQARRYALRALEKYGGVDIPEEEFDAWAKKGTVPIGTGSEMHFLPDPKCESGYGMFGPWDLIGKCANLSDLPVDLKRKVEESRKGTPVAP